MYVTLQQVLQQFIDARGAECVTNIHIHNNNNIQKKVHQIFTLKMIDFSASHGSEHKTICKSRKSH